MVNKFTHQDLRLPTPKWGSALVDSIVELESLRDKTLAPDNFEIFWELKTLFHRLEIWASARIEGNQTQLVDALDATISKSTRKTTDYQELDNLTEAMGFVDKYCKSGLPLDKNFILDVHKKVTENLPADGGGPGDATPGKFRVKEVSISKSSHCPPLGVKVDEYMEELVNLINTPSEKKNDIIRAAIAHHRFAWIHPFNNGNGRVARLLTYAMLIRLGYGVNRLHIINPSAIFYANRSIYYEHLAHADSGTDAGLLKWVAYFSAGFVLEIEKIDRLLDRTFLVEKILQQVLDSAYSASRLTDDEYRILSSCLKTNDISFVAGDLESFLSTPTTQLQRSRIIKRMRDAGVITTIYKYKQRYTINITAQLFLRDTIRVLDKEGFIWAEYSQG